jgi:hypothetical protein
MNAFTDADTRAADAFDRQLGEDIRWRPMVAGTAAGRYVSQASSTKADPARPVQDIRGIVTWRSTLATPDNRTPDAGTLGTGALTIDIDFDPWLAAGWVRAGDRLELLELQGAVPGNLVEVTRAAPLGSQLHCVCSVVQ